MIKNPFTNAGDIRDDIFIINKYNIYYKYINKYNTFIIIFYYNFW